MTEKIFAGFDCRKDYRYPTRAPRIYPRGITLLKGETVDLSLKTTHPQCDPACYKWEIIKGGGYLIGDFGIENIYYAPSDNDLCDQNPNIAVSSGGKVLDIISIGVTGTPKPIPAVLKAGQWVQHEPVLADWYGHLVGMKYCDPDPRWHHWTIRINEYGCDGSRIRRYGAGLISQLVEARCGILIYSNRFRQLRGWDDRWLLYGYAIWKSLDEAKADVLRYWLEDHLFGLGTRLLRQFDITMARWPNGKPSKIEPGQTLDIRMDKVIKIDCCPHLLAEIQHDEE